MNDSFAYRPAGAAVRDRTHTLFAQTMGYVAATAALFAQASATPSPTARLP